MKKRTAREIIVKNDFFNHEQINVRIGTTENRDFPHTIYINISFWVKPKKNLNNFIEERIKLEEKLKDILNNKLKYFLENSLFFPYEKENIYIYNIPENFNYNNKLNFISLETYLHTLNIKSEKKFPLNIKKNKELFEECLKVVNFISDNLKKIENNFYVRKKSNSISNFTS